MVDGPSNAHLGAVLGTCLVVVTGAWLPWVRKSVRYLDGDPYVTGEWLQGLSTGFEGFDILILGAVAVAVVVALLSRYCGWYADIGLVAPGAVVLWIAGKVTAEYRAVDHYVIRPGLVLVLVGGLLLVGLGAKRPLRHVLVAGSDASPRR